MPIQQQAIIGLVVVYITAVLCIFLMKKIEPDNRLYPIYSLIVCIALTCFLVRYAF